MSYAHFFFFLSGKNCETDIDDCVGVTCQGGTVCVDLVNGSECRFVVCFMLCPLNSVRKVTEVLISECIGAFSGACLTVTRMLFSRM